MRLSILGSTGSIGKNTLKVVAQHKNKFEVFALSAATQVETLLAQCAQFQPQFAVMASAAHAKVLAEKIQAQGLKTQVLAGEQALVDIAQDERVDAVMAAIVGAAGLSPCMAAAKAGKRLLLANKEALVVGGQLFLDAVKEGGATLLPIDSEHSAIFQVLPPDKTTWPACVDKIILTASGGPFLNRALGTFQSITPEEACAHPQWCMGPKISVDSASMMNKALEVIEAHYLFGLAPEQIEVLIHPQSVVHSMVQYVDGSVLAQMGTPDMRVPIAYGLAWPGRMASEAKTLDFSAVHSEKALCFEAADPQRFPSLQLAWQALAGPVGSAAILNAANEVAVQAFLEKKISFHSIYTLNAQTLEALGSAMTCSPQNLGDVLDLDCKARAYTQSLVASVL